MGQIILEGSIIYSRDDSIERIKKEQEYLDYIKEHIALVNKAYQLYMVPLLDKEISSSIVSTSDFKQAIINVGKVIDTHDASKFSDSEFDGYRLKYYPTAKELQDADDEYNKKVEERYEECWKHHYTVNQHHPKHWVNLDGTSRDMTLEAIIEMICDWEAMSLKFHTDTLKWYENDAKDEKACFSPLTRKIVDDIMYNIIHNIIQ